MVKKKQLRSSKSEDGNSGSHLADFEARYDRSRRYVFNLIYSSIENFEDAEELTADCFVKFYFYPKDVRYENGFLRTIAKNRITDYIRSKGAKKNKAKFISLDKEDGPSIEELPENIFDPVKEQEEEERRRERRELLLKISERILTLERDKELAFCVIDDLSDEEAARRLARSVDDLKHDLHLVRLNLRRKIKTFLTELDDAKVPKTFDDVKKYLNGDD